MGNDGCLERVPYASLMATASCVIGVILFAIMMTWGFNAAVEQTRRTLNIEDWPWLDRIRIVFIVIAVIMVFVTIFLLAIGIASTGSTRETMFRDKDSRFGGRVACAIAIGVSFVLFVAWLFMLSISALLLALYASFQSICSYQKAWTEADCIDLGSARPLVASFTDATLRICGGDAQSFCALTSTSLAWFIIGWIGALVVCCGLAQFMIVHAANYAHVGNSNRYVELRDIAYDSYNVPQYPYRGGTGEVMEEWAPRPAPPPSTIPTSRQVHAGSDSVSQYAYGRAPKGQRLRGSRD